MSAAGIDRVVDSALGIKPCADSVDRSVVFGQCLCFFSHVFPCPVVSRIFHARLVKESLVVPDADGIEILRKRILSTVNVVQGYQSCRVVRNIDALLLDHVIDRHQYPALCVLGDIRTVHPEYIRNAAAGSCCLQFRPVFIPCVWFLCDRYIRIDLVEFFNTLLNIRSLRVVPVSVAYFTGYVLIHFIRKDCSAPGHHDRCHHCCKPQCHPSPESFHNAPFCAFSDRPFSGDPACGG